MGHSSLKVTENSAIRYSAYVYEFLLAFHSNHAHILHRFWDIERYWSKIADLNLSNLYFGPRWGRPRWNFAEIFGISKLESLSSFVAFSASS